MPIHSLEFPDIPQFSQFDIAYATEPERFSPFISGIPSLNALKEKIHTRSKSYQGDRDQLVSIIREQYRELDVLDDSRKKQIERLGNDHCFTIITAHQPSLFLGALYFIYKAMSAIRTADWLSQNSEDGISIVPVFVIGGEDHDFEEIRSVNYRGQQLTWKEESGGPVGRMSTKNIRKVLRDIQPFLQKSFYGKEIYKLLDRAYDGKRNLAQATQYMMISLFAETSLVVVNMDEPEWKNAFTPYIEREMFDSISHQLVVETQQELEEKGFAPQAMAREINFFYVRDGLRRRIERKGERFQVVDSDYSFSESDMKREIREHSDRFSPNVVMRPIYQEVIFPNLAYVGGGGELAYWIERKRQFEAFGLELPVLIRRHSALLISEKIKHWVDEYPFGIADWHGDFHQLQKQVLKGLYENDLSFEEGYKEMHQLFDRMLPAMKNVDPTLAYSVGAARVDALKTISRLEKKAYRAARKKEKTAMGRMKKVREQLLPEGNLQERHQNFIQWYEDRGPGLLDDLGKAFDPLDQRLKVISFPL